MPARWRAGVPPRCAASTATVARASPGWAPAQGSAGRPLVGRRGRHSRSAAQHSARALASTTPRLGRPRAGSRICRVRPRLIPRMFGFSARMPTGCVAPPFESADVLGDGRPSACEKEPDGPNGCVNQATEIRMTSRAAGGVTRRALIQLGVGALATVIVWARRLRRRRAGCFYIQPLGGELPAQDVELVRQGLTELIGMETRLLPRVDSLRRRSIRRGAATVPRGCSTS